jgi:transcriptional regulator with GAF, ATPase, and Fis domain
MELILKNLKIQNQAANRLEALKTLTKLLLHEIESLAEISPSKGDQPEEKVINLNDNVQRYEITLICNALLETQGNQSKAAKKLGMKNTTLHSKIRRYEIDSLNLFGQFPDDESPMKCDVNGDEFRKIYSNENLNNV